MVNNNLEYYKKLLDMYPSRLLNFKLLNDGKLNRNFFNMFMIELLRDYIIFFKSFRTQNMIFLRNLTKPYIDLSPFEFL